MIILFLRESLLRPAFLRKVAKPGDEQRTISGNVRCVYQMSWCANRMRVYAHRRCPEAL